MEITRRDITIDNDQFVAFDIQGEIIGDARFELLRELLDQVMNEEGINRVIINWEQVPMIDSVGLGMITAAKLAAERQDGDILFAGAGRSVRYLLVITKLDTLFKSYDDEEDAIEAFLAKPEP